MHIFLLLLLFVNIWVLWIDVLTSVSFHIRHQVSTWCNSRQSEKKERFYSGTQQTEALLQKIKKARKYNDSWVWRSLGRYCLINHCIILFEIMLISKNKFNTVCFFYSLLNTAAVIGFPDGCRPLCDKAALFREMTKERRCNIVFLSH